ncbi:efflux RND transporter periplasmic adaptor subunit [Neorhizobium sp. DT-125]|uniref:efflux RND transporter periplasmic adaptor subunit n=1 Tax=Neorhizobium sp. DT-125 TaxID=3396163 RepID=UPI003F19E852
MTLKWTRRSMMAAALLACAYAAIVTIDPAGGTSDPNDRLKKVVASVEAASARPPLELSPMEIAKVEPMALSERLRVSGEIRPFNQATLRARSGGRIVQSDVREGQAVKAGDVLVRFEVEDLHSVLNQKEADRQGAVSDLLLAMQSLARIEQLAGKNVASQEQLERARGEVGAAKARLDSLSAQVEIARIALRDADVLAPFDGTVSKLSVGRGARVGADAELLTLVDVSVMEAKVLVSTRDVSRVAVGQEAELRIDGIEQQTILGTVARINPTAQEGSRSVAVYIRLAHEDPRLKGGMFVTGTILVRQAEDAIAVPIASLRQDRDGAYVLKLSDDLLVRQPVTVISRWHDDETAQILGLVRGDVVVTAPLRELHPSLAVRMTEAG